MGASAIAVPGCPESAFCTPSIDRTRMALMLNIHHTRAADIVVPDLMTPEPYVPMRTYADRFVETDDGWRIAERKLVPLWQRCALGVRTPTYSDKTASGPA